MKTILITAACLVASLPRTSEAAGIVRHPGVAGGPILSGVTVPAGATTLYLSGQVPAVADPSRNPTDPSAYGDTRAQAISVFRRIEAKLKTQGYTLGDVVKLTVFLVGDPAHGGKQDFAGFQHAYGQFFGTADQPHIVARSTVQVAALANPGFLVEIEAIAAKVL